MKTHSLHNYSLVRNFRTSIFVALLMLVTTTTFAQQCQYCPSEFLGNNLTILTTKKYITFDKTITDTTTLKQVLNLPSAVIQRFGELSIINDLDNILTNRTTEDNWAIIEGANIGNIVLSNNNLILSESPVYITPNNEELVISHLFYVKLNAPSDFQILENFAQQNNVEILGNNKFMPLWYTLSCNKNSLGNSLQMANLFHGTGLFTNVQPDFMVKIETTCVNDPLFPNQWGLENTGQNGGVAGIDINLCQAHQITTGSNNVVVAVIDGGVEKTHPDLTNIYPVSFNIPTGTSPSQNVTPHGTNVAGIISANKNNSIGITGISPDSPIMSISMSLTAVISPGDVQKLANAVNFAWQNGAAVINNSWYISSTTLEFCMLNTAFCNAMTQGRNGLGSVVVFASANGNTSTVSYPANFHPDIITVGAMSPCGERWSPTSCGSTSINYGSNFGVALDVVAPGDKIPTTNLGGGYVNFSATSSAAPHVAGIAALILSVNPCLTQQQVGDIIEATAQKVGLYNYQPTVNRPNGTWYEEVGYGLVDAEAAVLLAQSMILTPLLTTIDVTCSGSDINGSASVTITGGVAPFTYLWSGLEKHVTNNTATINNLNVGSYGVTVTDANGCQATGTVVINQDPSVFFVPYETSITGNVTWNYAKVNVDGVVYVEAGATLTIPNGTRVEFSHHPEPLDPMPNGEARLIVKSGGNLIVEDNAVLTGCSGGVWDGIEVWGTGIFNTGQATATINAATIENADIGIFTDRRPKINMGIVNSSGGLFSATGTQFTNCRKGIVINRNLISYNYIVSQSTFTYDNNSLYTASFYPIYSDVMTHITAGENIILTLQSNNFNGGINYFAGNLGGTGLLCNDCNPGINNSNNFSDLSRGIEANYIYTSNQLKVIGNNITNCQEGIFMQGSSLALIQNNTFNVPVPVSPIIKSYGLFSVSSDGFDVSGNTVNPVVPYANSYGMVFENSGAVGGVVFNNTFNNVGIGLQAQKNNQNLKVGCNNFNNPTVTSLAVVNVPSYPISLMRDQGLGCATDGDPAGNEWIYSCNTSTSTANVFTSKGITFKYYSYFRNQANQPFTIPSCSSPIWEAADMSPWICNSLVKTSSSCNSVFRLSAPPPLTPYPVYFAEIQSLITDYKNQISILKPQLATALQTQDGGNTQNLLNKINQGNISIGKLKNLLTNSNALSDEVLIAAINRNPTLPPGILKDILFQQAPLSVAVLTALENLYLPNGIKNNIYQAQSNSPLYTKAATIEREIQTLNGEITLLESEYQRKKNSTRWKYL